LIGSKCPLLQYQGVGKTNIGSSVKRLLFPFALLVANGGDDYLVSSVDGRKVNNGRSVGMVLNLYGFLERG
jgi:hypothetical protein